MSDKSRTLTLVMRAVTADFAAGMDRARNVTAEANLSIRDSFRKNFGDSGTTSGAAASGGLAINGIRRMTHLVQELGEALKKLGDFDPKLTGLERAAGFFEKAPLVGGMVTATNSVLDGVSQIAYQTMKAQGASEKYASSFLTLRVEAERKLQAAKEEAELNAVGEKQRRQAVDVRNETALLRAPEAERDRLRLEQQKYKQDQALMDERLAAKAIADDDKASKFEKDKANAVLKGVADRRAAYDAMHEARLKDLADTQNAAAAKQKLEEEEKARHLAEIEERKAEEERKRQAQEAARRSAEADARRSTPAQNARRGSEEAYGIIVAAQLAQQNGAEKKAEEQRADIAANTKTTAEALEALRAIRAGRI